MVGMATARTSATGVRASPSTARRRCTLSDTLAAMPGPARQLPFAIVMRGYDREQVADHLQRLDAELRVLAADRDAATANAHELAAHLEDARDEIAELRREVDKLSVPPTTAQGMSERLSRMLQLASDEASEMRAEASAEAAETLSIARQEAADMRSSAAADAERVRGEARTAAKKLVDEAAARARQVKETAAANESESARLIAERAAAMEAEHTKTMSAANDEARRIVEKAKAEVAELEAVSARERDNERERHDAELADQRERALDEAAHIRQTALDIAAERLNRSRELAQAADRARLDIAANLGQLRDRLAELPALLAQPEDSDFSVLTDAEDLELLNRRLSPEARAEEAPSNA